MSNVYSLKDAEQKITQLDIPSLVRFYMDEHKIKASHLSRLMGKDANYIAREIKRKKPNLALFYAISIHLQINIFEHFQNLLPENLRSTRREMELKQQIEDRDKQIADLKKEIEIMNRFMVK